MKSKTPTKAGDMLVKSNSDTHGSPTLIEVRFFSLLVIIEIVSLFDEFKRQKVKEVIRIQ